MPTSATENAPEVLARPTSSRLGRLAAVFVWGVWGAMTVALLGYVGAFARDVPWWDDWALVPVLSGQEPVSVDWLWDMHYNHRIVVPKLIHLALAWPAGADFRVAPCVNCLGLAVGALALIVAARRLRGHTSFADALFPIWLLHWGQDQNLIQTFQVQFICPTVLFLFAVALLVTARPETLLRRGVLVGLCALPLPFCGANGVVLAPALALWLAGAAVVRWRAGRPKGQLGAALLAVLAVLVAGALVVSLLGYAHSPLPTPTPGVGLRLRLVLLVLLMAGGPIGAVWGGPLLGLFVLLLSLAAAVVLGWATLAGRVDRLRGLGVVACLGAVVALGVAVGWGRASVFRSHPGAIASVSRYVTLMSPLVCCAALAWILARKRPMPYLLLAAGALMLPANTLLGWEAGRQRADILDRFADDARRGVPPDQLSETYRPQFVYVLDHLAERIAMLRAARLGPYRGLPAQESLPPGPAEVPGGLNATSELRPQGSK